MIQVSRATLGSALIAVLAAVGCTPRPVAPVQPSVVLILIDTLRADHMSVYGYERPTTPAIEAAAANAAVIENAFSAAAWTLPSVTSILTGQWPSVHGAGFGADNRFARMPAAMPTLTERLRDADYRTGVVASAGYFDHEFGFDRGFEHYDFVTGNDVSIRRADVNVDHALEWLRQVHGQPFFLLLQVFDVHRHYDAPTPIRGTFTDVFAGRYGDSMATLESRLHAERDGDLDFLIAAYDEEILFVDTQLGRFLRGLEELGLDDDTLVILTADHGEAFFEHGARGHGSSVHNEVIRVPLIVWGPGVTPGRFVGPASTVDILRTVLDFSGLPTPDAAGISIRPLWQGDVPPRRILFSENAFYDTSLTAAIEWPYKAIRDFKARQTLLYDLAVDPQERSNLLPDAGARQRRLARELVRHARDLRQVASGEDVSLDEATRERLRALGYIR